MATFSIAVKLNRVSNISTVNQWNSQIREAANQNNAQKAVSLFRQMKQNGFEPNNFTIPFLAKACAKLSDPKLSQIIHTHIIKSPFSSNVFVGAALVGMYVKCDGVNCAYKAFEEMPQRDVATWNVMIVGFGQVGFSERVLSLFRDMRYDGIQPDSVTIMALTQGMLQTKNLSLIKAIHSFGVKMGIDVDVPVANTFVSGYAKCGYLRLAEAVFGGIEKGLRTLVSWNSMIAGYSNFKKYFDGFRFYKRMLIDGFMPDISTIVSLLASCVEPEALNLGRLIHTHGIQLGSDLDVCVINTLISMYSKCGDIDSARFLFDSMSIRTCVSWTAMISGYAERGNMEEAMVLFNAMEADGQKPDLVAVISLILGCGQMGALELGKWMDHYATSNGLKDYVIVCNALIDMYAKCGSIYDAERLFYAMPEKTVVSWTTMIAGYALHGKSENALDLFNLMLKMGLEPSQITFVAVLQACIHAGLLEKGWECFNMMTKYNVVPEIEHYSCMAGLLGRRGKPNEALEFVQNMPIKPDAGIWGALLGACKVRRDAKIGEHVARHLFELEPHVAASYVEMANIYASVGNWDGVKKIRSMMKCNRVRKFPGQSAVEVNGKSHTFTVEDRNHPYSAETYAALHGLYLLSKEEKISPLLEQNLEHKSGAEL